MRSLIQGGGIVVPSAAATEYAPLLGNSVNDWKVGQVGAYQVMPCDGKFSWLYVWTRGAPGAGKSRTFNLYVNGAATALGATIGEGTQWAEDITHEVSVSKGDLICMQHVPTNTPLVFESLWCLIFTSTIPGQSPILGCTVDTFLGKLNTGATEYASCNIGGQNLSAVENYYRQPIPTDGKFPNLYVDLTTAPDPGGSDGYTCRLRVNGAPTGLVVTITGDNTTGNAASDIDLNEGDIVTLEFAPLGTPSAEPFARWGLTWEPDVAGEGIVLGCTYDSQHATNTEYVTPTTWSASMWAITTGSRCQPIWEATIKKFYVVLDDAPSAGKSRAFTIRKRPQIGAEEDTALTLTISDAETDGNDITHEVELSDYDQLVIKTVPSGSPDLNSATGWGWVSQLPSVAAGFGGNPAEVLVKNNFI